MAEWEGWSTDWRQVDITRVLAVLFGSLGTDSQTVKSTDDALVELKIEDVQADELAVRLVELGLFRADSLSLAPAQDTLLVTPKGRRVEAEFRQATSERRAVGPAVRRALLLWRFDINIDWPLSSEMLTAPHAWFYGSRFSPETLAEAADNLVERGYLESGKRTFGRIGRRIQLTAAGLACVEKCDGDSEAMETAHRNGQHISIASYHQQGGSAAFGSTVRSQFTGPGPAPGGGPATDLASILQIVAAAGEIPEALLAAAADVQVALHAVADGAAPGPALERIRALITSAPAAGTNSAALALLDAAVGFTQQRLTVLSEQAGQ